MSVMGIRDKNKKKTKEIQTISREEANKRAKKYIATILIVGLVIMAADLIMSSGKGIEVESSYGQLYLVRPEAGEDSGYVSLVAEVEGKEGSYEKNIDIILKPYSKQEKEGKTSKNGGSSLEMTEEEKLDYYLRSITDEINSDSTVKKVGLPVKLETGEKIKWKVENTRKTNTVAIAMVMVAISVVIYRERFSTIKRREEEERRCVLRQLPGFINRLVLLLDAGLVINNAFEKAVEESIAYGSDKDDYFYSNLKNVYITIKTANGSMGRELRRFAVNSGVQEMVRVANIINDNICKGTELNHKLRSEGDILWTARKKRCEEIGKLADTKLTLPLMLLLLVLIVITVAPALMGL